MRSIETSHFLIQDGRFRPRFPDGISNELADHIAAELVPLGLVPDGPAFEQIFVETVLATQPEWHELGGNVIGEFIANPAGKPRLKAPVLYKEMRRFD